MKPLSSLLLAATVAVVLSGCGAVRPAATPFQVRANAICTRMNTSPFLDTKALFAADLRKTRLGIHRLSSLATAAPNTRELRDLVGSMQAIYAFDRDHESEWVALARAGTRIDADVMHGLRPRWGKATRQFAALVSRQIGGDENEKFREARALGLGACNEASTVGRTKLTRLG